MVRFLYSMRYAIIYVYTQRSDLPYLSLAKYDIIYV